MLGWQCWLTLVWMVLMSVAACRLTNGRPRRKLHFLIASACRSPREPFIRHWWQAFNLEPPNGNGWALQRMLDTISHAQVRRGSACLSLTSCSPPLLFHSSPFGCCLHPIFGNSHLLTHTISLPLLISLFSGLRTPFPFYYLRFPHWRSVLCLLTIFLSLPSCSCNICMLLPSATPH